MCGEANPSLFFNRLDVYWIFVVYARCSALELKLKKRNAAEIAVNLKYREKKKTCFAFYVQCISDQIREIQQFKALNSTAYF